MGFEFGEDTGEVFVDGVGVEAEVGSPAAAVFELDFDAEVVGEGGGDVVGGGELEAEVGAFVGLLGEGVVGEWEEDRIGDVLGEVDFGWYDCVVLHVGLEFKAIASDDVGDGDADHGAVDCSFGGDGDGYF